MTQAILSSELARDVAPGDELGVIYEEAGALTDLVISSCASVPNLKARWRTVAIMCGREAVDLYSTTHCDSGNLLASLASHDVLVS